MVISREPSSLPPSYDFSNSSSIPRWSDPLTSCYAGTDHNAHVIERVACQPLYQEPTEILRGGH